MLEGARAAKGLAVVIDVFHGKGAEHVDHNGKSLGRACALQHL